MDGAPITVEAASAAETLARQSLDALALIHLEQLWRSQGDGRAWTPVTPYDEPSRREREGPHADLIIEHLKPTSILDWGAGFGYLEQWLRKASLLQGRAQPWIYSYDPNPRATHVSQRVPDACLMFDVVICREVLEHVPLRETLGLLRSLTLYAKRLVYLTCRLASAPASVLTCQTHDDLDPTHQTLLHPALIRILFVLLGFRRRADLESALDHERQGRCFIYERQPPLCEPGANS